MNNPSRFILMGDFSFKYVLYIVCLSFFIKKTILMASKVTIAQ